MSYKKSFGWLCASIITFLISVGISSSLSGVGRGDSGYYALLPTPIPNSTEQTETVHYLTLKCTQSSFTLSIAQHLKDSANTFYITLPTTKKFYNSVKVGDVLGEKFKTASFLISGNIGSRKIYVDKKFTKREPIGEKGGH